MNFSQRLGLFLLIVISVAYVYFSFFNNGNIDIKLPHRTELTEIPDVEFDPIPNEDIKVENPENTEDNTTISNKIKTIKIFVSDSKGNIRPVNRSCDTSKEQSCFTYAINELINAPSKWEKSKGFTSEIPQGTKILSIREGSKSVLLDLSSTFEAGGGTESTYIRIRQLIKTAKSNTNLPVYLYIDGKQANVIGGEGIMLKQPLNERSLDD